MRISAESTDDAFEKFDQLLTPLVAEIAEIAKNLSIKANKITVDDRVVIPYIEKDE